MKKNKIKCASCGNETSYKGNEFRPFCSEKCKMVDLGHWFSETYTIPVEATEEELLDLDYQEDEYS